MAMPTADAPGRPLALWGGVFVAARHGARVARAATLRLKELLPR